MNRRRLSIAALSAALLASAGCATPYQPTARMLKLKGTMDPADAANLFVDSLGRTLKGAGLCKAPFAFDDPKPGVTMDSFTVQAWRKGEELGRKQEGGRTVVSYRKERFEEERRFRDIGRIEVWADGGSACAVAVPLGQCAVALHGGGSGPLVVAVRADALDELLAALAVLAPKAELVEGAAR
jgi:hypothetical protein